jgi:hypothetical protein
VALRFMTVDDTHVAAGDIFAGNDVALYHARLRCPANREPAASASARFPVHADFSAHGLG